MRSSIRRFTTTVALAGLSLLLMLPAGSALAAACKELSSQAACEKRSDCTWVKGYKRKDGTQVKSYCRTKGKASKNKGDGKKKGDTQSKKKDTAKKKGDTQDKKKSTSK